MKTYVIIFVMWMAGIRSACTQGFVNLDFENASLVGYGAGAVLATNAIPGWTAYLGGVPQTNINYDIGGTGGIEVSIIGATTIQGNYYMLLQGSISVAPSVNEPASIGQTGTIPATARTLIWWGEGPDVLSFDGHILPVTGAGFMDHFRILEADVSAYAGETGQLLFSSTRYGPVPGDFIDNIQFSSSPIPEPGALSLFALGVVGFVWQHRKWSIVVCQTVSCMGQWAYNLLFIASS